VDKAERYQSALQNNQAFYDLAFGFTKVKPAAENEAIGAIVPHHLLAADLMAGVYRSLAGREFDTIILIGPDHYQAGQSPVTTSLEDWQTPFGILKNDNRSVEEFLKDDTVKVDEALFEREHAVYNQIGFIKRTFPDAQVVPLALSPNVSAEQAGRLADVCLGLAAAKKVLVLVSADFSHNTDSATAVENNKQSLKIINNFDLASVPMMQVDSPPAILTILEIAQRQKAIFKLLADSNSGLLAGQPDIQDVTSYLTGYFFAP
jgi:AmmeMemoRadiSam system protein B